MPPSQVAPLPRRAHAALLSATLALLGACAPGIRPSTVPAPARPDVPAATPSDLPEPPTSATAPLALPAPPHVHLPGVSFDLDVHAFEDEERVQHYVRLFTGSARTTFTTWLSRGSRYDGMIRAKLRAAGLPEDLYFLPLVESGYDPNAVSRASAVGMWQFMAPTARGLGLRVDWWMDERRDPVRATDGAVRHIKWLKGQYGSFFLAAAAYNGGSTRVTRGLAQLAAASDSTLGDARFFALVDADYLRPETKNYVPQLIAATLVAKELPRYRLSVREQSAFAYDSVTVAPLTPLAAIARAANASRAELLDLNPHVLRGLTPPDARVAVRVPVGASSNFTTRFAKLDANARRAFRRATTRKRDTMEDIASREDVPLALLTAYNAGLETVQKGKWKGRLVSGQAVRVPTKAVLEYARATADANDAAAVGELPALPALPAPRVAKRAASQDDDKAKARVAEKSVDKSRERNADQADADVASKTDADSSRESTRAVDRTSAGEIARDADAEPKSEARTSKRGARDAAIAPVPLSTVVRVKPAKAKAEKSGAPARKATRPSSTETRPSKKAAPKKSEAKTPAQSEKPTKSTTKTTKTTKTDAKEKAAAKKPAVDASKRERAAVDSAARRRARRAES
ncbi:MAG: lytic transglycosylase domain-containing protein [Gemmatirosa sp.]